jgi:hypothetical protein
LRMFARAETADGDRRHIGIARTNIQKISSRVDFFERSRLLRPPIVERGS